MPDNGNIELSYDKDSFTLDTVPGYVRIGLTQGIFADSMRNAMTHDLVCGLFDYYNSVYTELA